MKHRLVTRMAVCIALTGVSIGAVAQCTRFPANASSAFDTSAGRITLPWRTDLPNSPGSAIYPWQDKDFTADWKDYINTVLSEVKATGVAISNGRISMNPQAEWWIAPWMDFGQSGRERINGLTAERGPDPRDLSPNSSKGYETWAIGWYNRPGAYGLQQIYTDPCDPKVPAGWQFSDQTASFKLLFSNASTTEVTYLAGSPEVEADTKRNNIPTETTKLRLMQVDIAVRDPRAQNTQWVMGTFVWRGPPKGDGFFDNLVPVGLMWGNDHDIFMDDWSALAPVTQSKINSDLAGILWQGNGVSWPERPFPGFQGRLNGPADNLRSSCLSCHAMAQWRRGPLGLRPSYPLQPKPAADKVRAWVADYFRDTKGGSLIDPGSGQTPLDYSLQLQTGFSHLCDACKQEKLTGATPQVCKAPQVGDSGLAIDQATCGTSGLQKLMFLFSPKESELSNLPRQ
ncbi:hypothetical protein [Pseudomonas sp. PAB10]|uniref:hypothetical protein n=1 Tax=Pseudomonas sp. PAB10 TaxID=3233047 RepID=UPI003F9B321C